MHRTHHSRQVPESRSGPAGRRPRAGLLWSLVCSAVLLALAMARGWTAPAAALQIGNPAWTTFTDELDGGSILSILVDEGGAVWFGTGAGISRFDGRWQSYTTADGLPAGAVTALAQTEDGTIWAGTVDGLARATGTAPGVAFGFAPFPEVEGAVRALAVDRSGVLWVGLDEGAGSVADGMWRPVQPEGGAQGLGRVLAIAVDSNDDIWLGGDALHLLHPATGKLEAIGIQTESPIRALLAQGPTDAWPMTLWAGTQADGLWSYNGQEWAHFLRPVDDIATEGIASNAVLALSLDGEGTLWIGTNGNGISLFNRDGLNILWGDGFWRTLTTVDGLGTNAVGALAMDDHGIAWIGTIYGVTRFDSRTWRTITSPDLPAGLDVVTELVDADGVLWAGTEGSGLIRFDGRTLNRYTEAQGGLPEDYVRTLAMDRAGNLWVGTATEGVGVAPVAGSSGATGPAAAAWTRFGPEHLGSGVMRASITAHDGSLWFGTFDAGLAHFIPEAGPGDGAGEGRWERFTLEEGLASNEVNQDALLEDSEGDIWVGTPAGLSRLSPASGTWRTYTTGDGLDDNAVLSVVEVAPGQPGAGVYAGTLGGGLHRFEPESGTWTRVFSLATPINTMVAIPGQGIWLGGSGGMTRFDPATDLRTTYTRADGLIDNHVSALAAGPEGAVWVGTKLGISRHLPSARRPSAEIVSINGQRPLAEGITILSGEPAVIGFRGSDLVTPEDDLGFRVRLGGAEGEWQQTRERQMIYRGLAPGDYAIEVQAWNAAMNLSEPAVGALKVVPSGVLPWIGRVPAASALSIGAVILMGVIGTSGFLLLTFRNRRRRREALQRRFNPYVSGDPILDSDMFFGREQTLAKIVNTLHENSIMVHGERRIGKTSLLYQLARQLEGAADPDYLFVPVYIDLEGTSQDELFHVLMEEILQVMPAYLPELPALRFSSADKAGYDDRDFGHDLGDLLEALSGTTDREVRLILLLDEMDVINDYDPVVQQKLRRIFMRTFARSLGAVVAGTQISKEWDRVESPWYNMFNEIELGPLDRDAALRLILEPVRGIYGYDPEAVEFIIDSSSGRPFYVQQHCLEAVNAMLAAGRTRVTLQDAQQALAAIAGARTSPADGTPVAPAETMPSAMG